MDNPEFFLYQEMVDPLSPRDELHAAAVCYTEMPVFPEPGEALDSYTSSNFVLVQFEPPVEPPDPVPELNAWFQQTQEPQPDREDGYQFDALTWTPFLRHHVAEQQVFIFTEEDQENVGSFSFVDIGDPRDEEPFQLGWLVETAQPVIEEEHEFHQSFFYTDRELVAPDPFDPSGGIPPTTNELPFEEDLFHCGALPALFQQYFVYPFVAKVCDVSAEAVWNIALMKLGAPAVVSVTDTTAQAKRIAPIWDNFRRAYIEDHPWNGSKKTVTLSRRTEKPLARWQYMYDFPADYIQALAINGNQLKDGDDLWEIETDPDGEKKVLMTDAASVSLQYIFDPVNLCLLSPKVIEAMGYALAAYIAQAFGKKSSEVTVLINLAEEKARQARSNDSREGIPPLFYSDDLADVGDDPRSRFPFRGEVL